MRARATVDLMIAARALGLGRTKALEAVLWWFRGSAAGNYVLLDQDELDEVAPGRRRSMDNHRFVKIRDIDPTYFNQTYFLGPQADETKETYALPRDAMARSDQVAIAASSCGKEYLAAARADGGLLVLETLFFAEEVRDMHKEMGSLPGPTRMSQEELRMAGQLIDAMSGPWRQSD